MSDLFSCLEEIIKNKKLPSSNEFLGNFFHDEEGNFYADENSYFDYKEQFPFSQSDEYFQKIYTLICAFHNTFGGLIIFGVNDGIDRKTKSPTKRKAGKNLIPLDEGKINKRISETLNYHPKNQLEIRTKDYDTPSGKISILLVPKRSNQYPPIRFKKSLGKIKNLNLYKRQSEEVIKCDGKNDLQFLYGSRESEHNEIDETSVNAIIPAPPFTIKQFIGRTLVIEKLFNWLIHERACSFFLIGNGGTGKSYIAYEFAEIIANNGKLKNFSGMNFDYVIYLSAKEIYLETSSGKIERFRNTDFFDSVGMYKNILSYTNFDVGKGDIDNLSKDELLEKIEDLFSNAAIFLIIDDIDTLSNKGKDSGIWEINDAMVRSQKESGSKVLFTQRTMQDGTQSFIKVPGLDQENELPNFLNTCIEQFNVPEPNENELNEIVKISELRPLTIETLVQFRRITDTYQDAFLKWNNINASQARDYLFEREYDRLPNDNIARRMLALLSIKKGLELTQEEIINIIPNFDKDKIQESIAKTKDIFIQISFKDSGEDIYRISTSAETYISERSKSLDFFTSIESRYNTYKREVALIPPAVLARIKYSQTLRKERDFKAAWSYLDNPNLPSGIIEEKSFIGEKAIVASELIPKKTSEARGLFEDSFKLGNREIEFLIKWLNFEDQNDRATTDCIKICNDILRQKINPRKSILIRKKLSVYLNKKANMLRDTAPEQCSKFFQESTFTNIENYYEMKKLDTFNNWEENRYSLNIGDLKERASKSISLLASHCKQNNDIELFLSLINKIKFNDEISFDDFKTQLLSICREFVRRVSLINLGQKSAVIKQANILKSKIERNQLIINNVNHKKEFILLLEKFARI